MSKFFDADGKEVEGFTAEEFETKKGEAIAEYTKSNPSKATELADAQKKITDLEEKIKTGGGNEGQKERLKEAKEAAEAALKDLKTTFEGEIKGLKDQISGTIKAKRGQMVDAVSGKDADKKAKIDLKVDALMKTGEYTNDEAGIAKAVADAATLVNGNRPSPQLLDGITGGGARGEGNHNAAAQETEAQKQMRKNLGITDEDVKKHGEKSKNK